MVDSLEKHIAWIRAVGEARHYIPHRYDLLAKYLDDGSDYFMAIVPLDNRFELHGVGTVETSEFTRWYLFDKKFPPEERSFYAIEIYGKIAKDEIRNMLDNWGNIAYHLEIIEDLIKTPKRGNEYDRC